MGEQTKQHKMVALIQLNDRRLFSMLAQNWTLFLFVRNACYPWNNNSSDTTHYGAMKDQSEQSEQSD